MDLLTFNLYLFFFGIIIFIVAFPLGFYFTRRLLRKIWSSAKPFTIYIISTIVGIFIAPPLLTLFVSWLLLTFHDVH